jgi:hypothetical protein
MGSTQPTFEILMDLLPTKWQRCLYLRARIKQVHDLVEAHCAVLKDEASTLSSQPEIAQDFSVMLQRFRQMLDAQAREHLTQCSRLYAAYETEYDDYIVKRHYATSDLSDEGLYRKLEKACKSFLTSRVGLAPCEHWPEFYQVIEKQNELLKADVHAPFETVQPEPGIMGSALSIEVSVASTDNRPGVLETSPMPEREMVAECMRVVSRTPQSQLSPSPILMTAVPFSEQPLLAYTKGRPLLIPSSLVAQESNVDKYECKEPDKASRTRSHAVPSFTPAHSLPFSPSARQYTDRATNTLWWPMLIISKMNKTDILQGLPMAENAPLPLAAVLACLPQAPSAPASPAEAGPLQPLPPEIVPIIIQEACAEAPSSLIPDLLVRESSVDRCECTYDSRIKPKEPDKACSCILNDAEARVRVSTAWFQHQSMYAGAHATGVMGSFESNLKIRPNKLNWSSCGTLRTHMRAAPARRAHSSLSISPQMGRAKQHIPANVMRKTIETRILQDSPCPRAAPTLPITVPAHSSQAPSAFPFGKIVQRQRDTKIVAKTSDKSSGKQHLPIRTMDIVLPSPSPSALLFPSECSLSFEEDKVIFETEEKQLADMAVSKRITSGEQSSLHIGTALRCQSLPARLTRVLSSCHVSLSLSASLCTDRARQPGPINVINKTNEMNVPRDLPRPMTAPTLSTTVPAHPSQAPSIRLFPKAVL